MIRLASWMVVVLVVASASSAPAQVPGSPDVNRELGLVASQIAPIDITLDATTDLLVAELEVVAGQPWTIELARHSLRADGFQVLVDDGLGTLQPVAVPEVSTWRGEILQLPGAVVYASWSGAGLRAFIDAPAEAWIIEPLAVGGPTPVPAHVVYRAEDAIPPTGKCGTGPSGVQVPPGSPGPLGPGLSVAEIAFDADFEFFQLNGSSVDDTVAAIEEIMNMVGSAYEPAPVSIVYEITNITVRSTAADPYTTSDAIGLLTQFSNTWNSPPENSIPRDLAHLATGRDLNGGIIAIAQPAGVCSPTAHYSLTETYFSPTFLFRATLIAHELGHAWNATHCETDPVCRIMCAQLGGCSGLDPFEFAPGPAAEIADFRDSVSCLSDPSGPEFIRGDADFNGTYAGLVDSLYILDFFFSGGPPPPCDDAADVDDDGTLNGLVDALFSLAFQFTGGAPPPPPFPDPGDDPTADALGCTP